MACLRWAAVGRRALLVWTTALSLAGCFSEDGATADEESSSDAGTTAGFTTLGTSSTTQGSASSDSGSGVDSTDGSATAGSSGSASSTGTMGCQSEADCDDEISCTFDTCELGDCDHSPMDGIDAPPAAQTDADCLRVVCVQGTDVAIDDDSDLPDDMNVCTDDLCTLGVPSNPPLPLGTECNRTGQCDGNGACSECLSPDDCDQLPADDDCQTRTCVGGDCGQTFASQGTEVNPTMQATGDCQLVVCDGMGGTESIDDDGDVPVDGLPCTEDVCTAGVPSNPNLPNGTQCGMSGMCDDGSCVGCVDPDDCGGVSTFCQAITCVANICGVDNTDAGTPLPPAAQTDGDCQELRCDGAGAVMPVADGTDLPSDDNNDCTAQECTGGNPHYTDLPVGTACNDNGGNVCDGSGGCVECLAPSDCPMASACQQATCNGDNECGVQNQPMGTPCSDGVFCNGSDTCNNVGQCVSSGNPCMGPDGDNNCAESCNEAGDNCLGADPNGTVCSDGLFCTTTDNCQGGTCMGMGNPCQGPDPDADCSESCDENANDCNGNDPNGVACNDGNFCSVTDTCMGGNCVGAGNPCPGGDGDNDCSESCNELANNCSANDPQGSACSDNLFCTTNEVCNANGLCAGVNPCPGPDGDGDCRESCSENSDNCLAPDPTGSACDDSLFCTATDACNQFGTCVGNGDPCPQEVPNISCKEGCSENSDDCTGAEGLGKPCDDGMFCTMGDQCDGTGTCTPGDESPCPGPDGDGDCSESCSEFAGDCIAGDPVGSQCDTDGLFCNGHGVCNNAAVCNMAGATPPCPGPDGDSNCSESCDEGADLCCAEDPDGSACVGTMGNGQCQGGCCSSQGGPCIGPCI